MPGPVSTVDRPHAGGVAAAAAGPRRHLPSLDGLRAVAVGLVVGYHAFPDVVPGGFVGVDLFFVLSGFLITGVLLRERAETGTTDLRGFWTRRVRRLVPGLVAMLLVVSAATLAVGRDTSVELRSQLVGALTWTSNWVQVGQGWTYADAHLPPVLNHLWSLGVEEQFYVLWPVLFVLVLRLGRRWCAVLLLLLAAGSFALMALWWSTDGPDRAYLGLDSHAGGLLVGAALAMGAARCAAWVEASPGRATAAGGAGLVVVTGFAATTRWADDATFLGGLALCTVAAAGLVVGALHSAPLSATLSVPPLRWLGERSYGIYLWHWPLIVMAQRIAPQAPGRAAVVAVAFAVAAAAASYRWIEVPMRRDGVRATLRRWSELLRSSDSAAPRAAATVVSLAAVFAGAAVAVAPNESELDASLRVGERYVSASATGDRPPAPAPAPAPAPLCRAVAPDAPVSAFGDSVTVALAPVLMGRRPGSTAVAAVGWQYADVARAVREAAAVGALHPTVVIATGTNGAVDQADLESLLAHELAGRRVALVLPSVPGRSWTDQALGALGAAAGHGGAVLVDWAGVVAARPDLTVADRVHPSAAGQPVLVDLLGESLARC